MESTANTEESHNTEESQNSKAEFFFSKYIRILLLRNFLRLDHIFDEFYLSEFQKVMATQFIRDHLSNKENSKVDRLQEWLTQKINDKSTVEFCDPCQVGCPEIIPKLTASSFWSFF